MTTLIQRMREISYAATMPNQPSEAICTVVEDFRRYAPRRLIIWDRTTSGAIRFTCGKSASSISERHRTMLPPSGSFT